MKPLRCFARPVAAALAAAHVAGVVHRDVKPENVFVTPKDEGVEVRVLDFGVAKMLATDGRATSLTDTGAMLGTPYYMAPEQAFGERDVGPAADAWAFGIVLYECLSGARPTQADNLGQVIKLVTQAPIRPIQEVAPEVPDDLAAIVASPMISASSAAARISSTSDRASSAERPEEISISTFHGQSPCSGCAACSACTSANDIGRVKSGCAPSLLAPMKGPSRCTP